MHLDLKLWVHQKQNLAVHFPDGWILDFKSKQRLLLFAVEKEIVYVDLATGGETVGTPLEAKKPWESKNSIKIQSQWGVVFELPRAIPDIMQKIWILIKCINNYF